MLRLRRLSIRDVGNALVRRELRLALHSENLCSNAVSTARVGTHAPAHPPRRPETVMIIESGVIISIGLGIFIKMPRRRHCSCSATRSRWILSSAFWPTRCTGAPSPA